MDHVKRSIAAAFLLTIGALRAFADWHHHSSHPSGPPDPHLEAFLWTALIVLASSLAVLFLGGSLLIVWGRRPLNTLWIVPLVNLLLYVLSVLLRPYPGGLGARLAVPGIFFTIAEVAILLVGSLLVALIIMAIQWLVRKARSLRKDRLADGAVSRQETNA